MKKIILVLILSILMLSISGCTDEFVEETPATDVQDLENASGSTDMMSVDTIAGSSSIVDLVPTENLPENYELLGTHELSADEIGADYVEIEGIVEGLEGLYLYSESTDVQLEVIETNSAENAEEFITTYKSEFSNLRVGDRFTNVSVNGHNAVQILDYVTVGSEDVKRYALIWSNGKFVFVVDGATEDIDVLLTLAESTGY
ncbi:hypothetical protein [Methanolobus bombayensis]|uniref:hypothetical protein n=1 Tax=Methanolobus bombayensis TaxID=38023 RepID=UPI001AE7BEF9|nr:hypothetical protein [Methanolobus bombayensis]MBP1910051.1 hypothetical protein [Methanolobus bombayensis]